MLALNDIRTSNVDREGVERRLAVILRNVPIPVNPFGAFAQTFRVAHIEYRASLSSTALLTPTSAGFIVTTRIPRSRIRDLRYVLLHEFTHTLFYSPAEAGIVPRKIGHPYEEELCDYGARAMIVPQRLLVDALKGGITLSHVLALAERCDAHPQWVACRVFLDLSLQQGIFLRYDVANGQVRKSASSEVVGLPRGVARYVGGALRKKVKTYLYTHEPLCSEEYLGPSGRGIVCRIELKSCNQASIFGSPQQVYVMATRIHG